MCCWVCCHRDDPSLCMCPGWPWFCIHYPWVKAARTPEFEIGSLLLTSACILCKPWLDEIPYNPIYVSWGVKTKHNTAIILSAGTQRSSVVWTLCTNSVSYTRTHTKKHTHTQRKTAMCKDCGLIVIGRCLRCWQLWQIGLVGIKAASLR